MSSLILIAYDPGKLTGIAGCVFNTESKEYVNFGGDQCEPMVALDALWQMAVQAPPTQRIHVVYERFTITQQTTKLSRQYDALDFIGACKWISRKCSLELESPTDPATAKRTVSDDKLRQLNMWVPGKDHARDAARHLVLLLLKLGWYSTVFG